MYDELIKALHDGAEFLECSTPGIKNSFAKMCHNAAEVIEELQQTVEHYKCCSDDWYKEACDYKSMLPRWTPVTERLPEDGIRCLVTRFDYVTKTPFIDLLWFEGGEWWNRHFCGDYAVTHWMSLPEAPGRSC